jgi:hypothetical protein
MELPTPICRSGLDLGRRDSVRLISRRPLAAAAASSFSFRSHLIRTRGRPPRRRDLSCTQHTRWHAPRDDVESGVESPGLGDLLRTVLVSAAARGAGAETHQSTLALTELCDKALVKHASHSTACAFKSTRGRDRTFRMNRRHGLRVTHRMLRYFSTSFTKSTLCASYCVARKNLRK